MKRSITFGAAVAAAAVAASALSLAVPATAFADDAVSPSTAIPTVDVPAAPEPAVFTARAGDVYKAKIWPDGGKYGVGVLPYITFNKAIPEKKRAAVVDSLTVSTSPTVVDGSWRWTSSTKVMFRPSTKFWPGNIRVTVSASLGALNQPGKPKAWASAITTRSFTIPRKFIININAKTDKGKLKINGKLKTRFLTSTGKAGFLTRSGIKTIMDKHRVVRMTNEGVTEDEVYDLQVPYAMRLTSSGEFLHAAPWNSRIGQANTSHGCTHLTLDQARWMYNNVLEGDPVVTKNTGRSFGDIPNGPGSYWNISYANWAN